MIAPIAPKNVNPLERDIVNARVFVTIAAPTDLTKSNAQGPELQEWRVLH
jgi:hypothetical protein